MEKFKKKDSLSKFYEELPDNYKDSSKNFFSNQQRNDDYLDDLDYLNKLSAPLLPNYHSNQSAKIIPQLDRSNESNFKIPNRENFKFKFL